MERKLASELDLSFCLSTKCQFNRICVPSIGPVPADVMFVCEAPGYREVEELTPLVGPAGRIFNKLLGEVGLKRSDVFLSNAVGCVDLEREDRRPLPAEIEACRPRLLDDILTVDPKVIITMGNVSQSLFFPGSTVSKVRGHARNWNNRVVVGTFHPAYLLPHRSPQTTPLVIEDLKLALSFL